ncbi:aldose epimerase [Brevibacillus sp. SYSU BS000544]|uniref:aldose epimerase family protein n=1 Tax=Brevibacillus sp. SYSU BS000544 TaxID=3416443 RepID=UPI003CE52219
MYQVRTHDDCFLIYELIDSSTNSWVKVAPERGGLIIGFGVQGEEILYLDKATFEQPDTNVRGGIPILFPTCGQLSNGGYSLDGVTYPLGNHGFARNLPWTVICTGTDGEASITLQLESNEETRKSYPFDFELTFTYALQGNKLQILQKYENKSAEDMPFYAGFHPYFLSQEKHLAFKTDATRYLDYNDMQIKPYEGSIDLGNMKESPVFLDAQENRISVSLPQAKRKLTLEYGKEFKYVVLWSVEGKEFVCVEPWMAKADAFNTAEDVVMLHAGDSLHTYFNITCDK